MADLNDLKKFGEDLAPIARDLFDRWAANRKKPDTSAEDALIARLIKLVEEANQPTPASVEDRAAAIVSLRSRLTEILITAATTSGVALDEERALIIQAQRDALRAAFGRLLELTALEPIARLLTKKEIDEISADLAEARKGIRQKKTAKAILDTVVDAAILASKIAVKLAAA